MSAPNPIHVLYDELRARGHADPRALLPDWWNDDAAMDDAGFTEALGAIARRLAPTIWDAGDLAAGLRAAARARIATLQSGLQSSGESPQ